MKQYLIINRLYSVIFRLSTVFSFPSSVFRLLSSVFCLPSSVFCVPLHLSRILYKSATFYAKQTQFPKKSNDVSFFYTTDYERKRNWTLGENKPNQTQLKPIKANFKPNQSQSPKSQNECKLNFNKGLQKKR